MKGLLATSRNPRDIAACSRNRVIDNSLSDIEKPPEILSREFRFLDGNSFTGVW